MSAVPLVRWWRPALVGPSWPQPPAASQTLWRCVLLAALLHLWLIVVVGNTQGGTAVPGQGVWGALNITLSGAVSGPTLAPPVPPAGPVGAARDARVGGAVRDEARAPRDNDGPGAAREGQWRSVPTPGAEQLDSGLAPEVFAPQRTPQGQPATDPSTQAALAVKRPDATALSRADSPDAVAPPGPVPAPPSAPERPSAAQPSAANRNAARADAESRPAAVPLAATRAQPSEVQVRDVRQGALPGEPVPDAPLQAPTAPSARELGAILSPADLPAVTTSPVRPTLPTLPTFPAFSSPLPAAGEAAVPLSTVPALSSPPLGALQALPRADLAPLERQLAATPRPADSNVPGSRVDSALPSLAPAPPPLEPPLVAAPRALPDPASSLLAEVVAERSLAPTAAWQRSVNAPVAPLRAPETATSLPAALPELPVVPSVPAQMPAPAAAVNPAGAAPAPDRLDDSRPRPPGTLPSAASPISSAPSPAAPGLPQPLRAGPDAGPVAGRDVATSPSASASAPLQLVQPRGAAREIARDAPRSVLNLMPPPPERKSRLASDIEQSARKDCRDAYAGLGVLAPLGAALDAARDRACKW
jgi:hypothetical protein